MFFFLLSTVIYKKQKFIYTIMISNLENLKANTRTRKLKGITIETNPLLPIRGELGCYTNRRTGCTPWRSFDKTHLFI